MASGTQTEASVRREVDRPWAPYDKRLLHVLLNFGLDDTPEWRMIGPACPRRPSGLARLPVLNPHRVVEVRPCHTCVAMYDRADNAWHVTQINITTKLYASPMMYEELCSMPMPYAIYPYTAAQYSPSIDLDIYNAFELSPGYYQSPGNESEFVRTCTRRVFELSGTLVNLGCTAKALGPSRTSDAASGGYAPAESGRVGTPTAG